MWPRDEEMGAGAFTQVEEEMTETGVGDEGERERNDGDPSKNTMDEGLDEAER